MYGSEPQPLHKLNRKGSTSNTSLSPSKSKVNVELKTNRIPVKLKSKSKLRIKNMQDVRRSMQGGSSKKLLGTDANKMQEEYQ